MQPKTWTDSDAWIASQPLLILADKAAKPLIELASVTGQYIEEALVTADLHPQLREALSLRNLPTLKQGRIMSQQVCNDDRCKLVIETCSYTIKSSKPLHFH